MIVVDSSELIAILQDEPERVRFAAAMLNASRRLVSAVSLLEAGIVMRARHGPAGVVALADLIARGMTEVVSFDHEQARGALAAFDR